MSTLICLRVNLLIAISLIVASVNLISIVNCGNHTLPDFWNIRDLVPVGYARLVPPRDDFNVDDHSPVVVTLSVYVLSLLKVNEPEQVSID